MQQLTLLWAHLGIKTSTIIQPLLGLLLAFVFIPLYLGSVALVPFHPDESTYVFMSRDFSTVFLERNPGALTWIPGQPITLETHYRLLDAPLTRYLIGLGWWLQGYSANDLNADWVWGEPWDSNQEAIPRPEVLLAGRTALAFLGALSTIVIYWLGCEVGGLWVGMAAALLLGLNPLVLLHTRRAMAESSLIFFSALAAAGGIWLARTCDEPKVPWWKLISCGALVGTLAGLAISSKQIEVVILPAILLVGALVLLQRAESWARRWGQVTLLSAAIITGCGITVWALNPILYQQPIPVLRQMIRSRAELVEQQIQVNGTAHPEALTPTPLARLRAALVEVFFRPPAFWDAPVYLEQLAPPVEAYQAQLVNRLYLQPYAGVVVVVFALNGLATNVRQLLQRERWRFARAHQLLWLWTVLTLGLLMAVIPFDWQRYFLPLLPPACLWAALGMGTTARLVVNRLV